MKAIYLLFLSSVLIPAQSYAVSCPAPGQVEVIINNYVKQVRAVPFPQCYYTASSRIPSSANVCSDIYQYLPAGLAKRYQVEISNWYCTDVRNKGYNYDYTFTFKTN